MYHTWTARVPHTYLTCTARASLILHGTPTTFTSYSRLQKDTLCPKMEFLSCNYEDHCCLLHGLCGLNNWLTLAFEINYFCRIRTSSDKHSTWPNPGIFFEIALYDIYFDVSTWVFFPVEQHWCAVNTAIEFVAGNSSKDNLIWLTKSGNWDSWLVRLYFLTIIHTILDCFSVSFKAYDMSLTITEGFVCRNYRWYAKISISKLVMEGGLNFIVQDNFEKVISVHACHQYQITLATCWWKFKSEGNPRERWGFVEMVRYITRPRSESYSCDRGICFFLKHE